MPQLMITSNIAEQKTLYQYLKFLLLKYPTIFEYEDLTGCDDEGNDVPTVDAAASLITRGIPIENVIMIEGWNHKAAAWVDLSRHLRLNLYVTDVFVPHQLGLTTLRNTQTREVYDRIVQKAADLEERTNIGKTDYATVRLPALAQLALARCLGDIAAFPHEVLELREKHKDFRLQLTYFDSAWSNATNRRERIKLQADFNNAFDTLIKGEVQPRERLIYKMWDLVKNPSRILEKIGDKFADLGRREQVIEQMRGLPKFWNDLLDAPVAEHDERLIAKTFGKIAEQTVWEAGRDFASAMRRKVGEKPEPGSN
jgi:hypothetical protein